MGEGFRQVLGPIEDRPLLKGRIENKGAQWTQWWSECLGRPMVVSPLSTLNVMLNERRNILQKFSVLEVA
jgi:hypothetical protein